MEGRLLPHDGTSGGRSFGHVRRSGCLPVPYNRKHHRPLYSYKKGKKSTVLVDRAAVRAECQQQLPERLIGPETQDLVEARINAECHTELDLRHKEAWGHTAVIAAPFLDEVRKTVDYGGTCGKCAKNTARKWPIRSRHALSRTSEMEKHLTEWHNLGAGQQDDQDD